MVVRRPLDVQQSDALTPPPAAPSDVHPPDGMRDASRVPQGGPYPRPEAPTSKPGPSATHVGATALAPIARANLRAAAPDGTPDANPILRRQEPDDTSDSGKQPDRPLPAHRPAGDAPAPRRDQATSPRQAHHQNHPTARATTSPKTSPNAANQSTAQSALPATASPTMPPPHGLPQPLPPRSKKRC